MTTQEITFNILVYDSIDELASEDAFLLSEARKVTQFAYAPYSKFHVGAFAMLENGKTVSGTNQENASYPVGICAERTLLSTASSLFPGVAIEAVAISYNNINGESEKPISPCGICRQSLVEFQLRTNKQIRIILGGMTGKVHIIDNAYYLLPLAFADNDIK